MFTSIFIIGAYLLTIGFLCYVALWPVWRQLPLLAQIFLVPLAAFYLVDVFMRVVFGTIIFRDWPTLRTITVTELCNKYCTRPGDYRYRIARGLCRILNIIQPSHCEAY